MSFVLVSAIILVIPKLIISFATPSSDFLLGIDGSSISTGYGHVCVLEQKAGEGIGGRAQCWGHDHKEDALESPKDMDFVQIVAANTFSCGITIDQTVYCWGSVSGYIPGHFEQITAASYGDTACGVLTDGKINCWGLEKQSSTRPADAELRYVQVSCAKHHCCALDSHAYPHCWSAVGASAETLPPTISYRQYLAAVSGPGVDMSILQRTLEMEDALRRTNNEEEEEDFEASGNEKGSVFGTEEDQRMAKIQFRQISVGEGTSCGITLLGAHLQCWGGKRPLQSPGPYRQVSVGRRGVCAITAAVEETQGNGIDTESREADVLQCWGHADSMVHHSGDSAAQYHWDQISVGATTVCGVTMDSELKCWGGSIPPELHAHPSKYIVA